MSGGHRLRTPGNVMAGIIASSETSGTRGGAKRGWLAVMRNADG
jgi:hypothetical protein